MMLVSHRPPTGGYFFREVNMFPKPHRIKRKAEIQEQCQVCGRQDETLCNHHIRSKGSGGGDEPDNLITVCASCHGKIHNCEISKKEVVEKKLGLTCIGGDF